VVVRRTATSGATCQASAFAIVAECPEAILVNFLNQGLGFKNFSVWLLLICRIHRGLCAESRRFVCRIVRTRSAHKNRIRHIKLQCFAKK
jgi:hypothetical protein